MNFDSFEEVRKNRDCFHTYRSSNDELLLEVRTKKLNVRGMKWRDMNKFYRRKFENLLMLSNPNIITKVRYV